MYSVKMQAAANQAPYTSVAYKTLPLPPLQILQSLF